MSTKDHPDWWKNVGGSNALDSMLERRSTVSNDNGIEDGTVAALSFQGENYVGKFFSRGMRGKIERIEVYGSTTPMATNFLRLSPHPCLGPIHEIQINVGVPWAWYGVDLEEMWDYDSLFIWFRVMGALTFIGYDEVQPHDDHQSGDVGATWADLDNRMFIRIIYTAETPGDVPISGIINNIPIPYASSEEEESGGFLPLNALTVMAEVEGIGHCDFIMVQIDAAANSHLTSIGVRCDDVVAFYQPLNILNLYGFTATTPGLTELTYAANGQCSILFTKRFEFRRLLEVIAFNVGNNQAVTVWAIPSLLR